MGDRLIISDNRDDPGNPLVLDGEAIDAAAQVPLEIGKLPGSPGELPPEAPTDPYVTLSRHTAPVIQPLPAHRANGQTGQGAVGQSAPGAHGCGDAYAAVVGASAAATRSAPD